MKMPRYTPMWLPVIKHVWRILDTASGEYVRDADGKALTFDTPEKACDKIGKLEKTS